MTDPNGWPDASKPGVPLTEDMRRAVWRAQYRHANERLSNPQPDEYCIALAEDRVGLVEQRLLDEAAFAALAPYLAAQIAEAEARGREAGMREAAEIARCVGRPAGASDGSTYVPGTSADAVAAILARVEPTHGR